VTIGLGGKGKLNFITGTKTKPVPAKANEATAEERAKIEEWETTYQMIMSWLLSTMEPRISNTLMYFATSKEIWDKTKKRYGQQSNFAHIFSLKQDLAKIKQNGQSNNELVTKIMTKWEELNVYLPPTTDPIETQKRSEYDLIFLYLGALDSTYEAIRSQILASAEMPEFDSVVARIQQEESRRALMNPQVTAATDNRAFRASFPNPNLTARAKGITASDWCDHCKRAGHRETGAGSSIRISDHRALRRREEVLEKGEVNRAFSEANHAFSVGKANRREQMYSTKVDSTKTHGPTLPPYPLHLKPRVRVRLDPLWRQPRSSISC
jgi:gag-polypeptide of LTR copia-type